MVSTPVAHDESLGVESALCLRHHLGLYPSISYLETKLILEKVVEGVAREWRVTVSTVSQSSQSITFFALVPVLAAITVVDP